MNIRNPNRPRALVVKLKAKVEIYSFVSMLQRSHTSSHVLVFVAEVHTRIQGCYYVWINSFTITDIVTHSWRGADSK